MKRIKIIALFIVISCVWLSGCHFFNNEEKSFETISNYVAEHINELNSFNYDSMPSDIDSAEFDEFIKNELGNDTIVTDIYCTTVNGVRICEFYCGGSGFVGGSTYTGFYYTDNNEPYPINNPSAELIQNPEGVYVWKDDNRELHTYKTIRIIDNWFYYREEWY